MKRIPGHSAESGKKAGSKILVVEDSGIIAMELEEMLIDSGRTVLGPAFDLETAFKLVREEQPSYALLDINLNGEKVFPLARHLQSSLIPFAFLTGYSGDDMIPPDFRATPRITKPVDSRALLRELGRLVDSDLVDSEHPAEY